MLLTYDGPAFHSTRNVPRGVWCWLPGLPGSLLTGPNAILPLACSQVMCLVRSPRAAAAAGQSWWSTSVSTSGIVARRAGAATLGAPSGWCRERVSAGTAFALAIATVLPGTRLIDAPSRAAAAGACAGRVADRG